MRPDSDVGWANRMTCDTGYVSYQYKLLKSETYLGMSSSTDISGLSHDLDLRRTLDRSQSLDSCRSTVDRASLLPRQHCRYFLEITLSCDCRHEMVEH